METQTSDSTNTAACQTTQTQQSCQQFTDSHGHNGQEMKRETPDNVVWIACDRSENETEEVGSDELSNFASTIKQEYTGEQEVLCEQDVVHSKKRTVSESPEHGSLRKKFHTSSSEVVKMEIESFGNNTSMEFTRPGCSTWSVDVKEEPEHGVFTAAMSEGDSSQEKDESECKVVIDEHVLLEYDPALQQTGDCIEGVVRRSLSDEVETYGDTDDRDKKPTSECVASEPLDIICSLHETPFKRRLESERSKIILLGRPLPMIDIVSSDKKYGQHYSRSFKLTWYENVKWLCGSSFTKSLYCWPCLLFSPARHNVWVRKGYKDLKNLSASTKKHELSKDHLTSCLYLMRFEKKSVNIEDVLNSQDILSKKLCNENVRKNRLLMSYLIDVTVTLAKQELAFCEDFETDKSLNTGNFWNIFQLLIKRDIQMQEHMEKIEGVFSDLSKTVQNDLIGCVSDYLMDSIKSEITDSKFFAIQVDDITDITEKSQCSISIRFVNNIGHIKERFLGFFDVCEDRTADALFNLVKNSLKPFDYKTKLVAQYYDGASIMAGSLSSLQGKIKTVAPNALFTHCYRHHLNLVLQNGARCIKQSRNFFATVTSISNFFKQSLKRTNVLDSIVGSCETQWPSQSNITHLLNREWSNLILVFLNIVDDKSSASESINAARGYLEIFNTFDFAFLATVYDGIYGITDLLLKTLQSNYLDITYCQKDINLAMERIRKLRTDNSFEDFYKIAISKLENCSDIILKKKMRPIHDKGNSSYRGLYFKIIDNILTQIDVRFQDLGELTYFSLVDSSKFEAHCNNFPTCLVNQLGEQHKNVFDQQKLINELTVVIYNNIQFYNLKFDELLKVFFDDNLQHIFSETHKLFVLIGTIPTVAIKPRFSILERMKISSQNTVTQSRITNLSLLSIEKELLSELYKQNSFTDEIINRFSLLKDRGIDLIYKA